MATTEVMLELYRAERASLDMPSDPFLSFGEWKEQYLAERKADSKFRVTVDLQQAVAEADSEVEEAEAELFNDEEETEMSETNVAVTGSSGAAPAVNLDAQAALDAKREAKNARRREQRAAAKAAASKPKAKAKAKSSTARTPRGESKTAKALVIFNRLYGKKERKDVIAAFMSQVGLSAAGASTYYQKYKATV